MISRGESSGKGVKTRENNISIDLLSGVAVGCVVAGCKT
jgi:hypothetical protein